MGCGASSDGPKQQAAEDQQAAEVKPAAAAAEETQPAKSQDKYVEKPLEDREKQVKARVHWGLVRRNTMPSLVRGDGVLKSSLPAMKRAISPEEKKQQRRSSLNDAAHSPISDNGDELERLLVQAQENLNNSNKDNVENNPTVFRRDSAIMRMLLLPKQRSKSVS